MRFPLSAAAVLVLALAGCATPQQKAARLQARAERETIAENTRAKERARMLAVENHEVNSERGAQILEYDLNKNLDPNRATSAAVHGYDTHKAPAKQFYSDHQVRLDTYQAKDFAGSKADAAADRKYATREANAKEPFLKPNTGTAPGIKPAETKTSPDANKVAASRALPGGNRQYLGPESKKLNTTISAKELANWRNGGESTGYTDGTVEKVSSLKPLSIEDIRDLLNKSK